MKAEPTRKSCSIARRRVGKRAEPSERAGLREGVREAL